MEPPKAYWFKRRRYGYGWTPATWQGMLSLLVFLVVVVGGGFMIADTPKGQFTAGIAAYIIAVLLASAGLAIISIIKGPPPKWRWGSKPDDNPHEDY